MLPSTALLVPALAEVSIPSAVLFLKMLLSMIRRVCSSRRITLMSRLEMFVNSESIRQELWYSS